jgi:MinD superfamily P-loop ATPase
MGSDVSSRLIETEQCATRILRWHSILSASCLAIMVLCMGCSAMGYSVGGIAGASNRHDLPVHQASLVPVGQFVWVDLSSGEHYAGRVVATTSPDTMRVRTEQSFVDGVPGYRPAEVRAVHCSQIARLQTPASSYRWIGLGIGAAADAAIITYVFTRDTSFKPSYAKVDTP